MNHTVLHTGGNVYNDYVADFDDSGRVLIASHSGLYVFACDRDYQLQLEPLLHTHSETHAELDPMQADSEMAELKIHHGELFAQHIDGTTLVLRLEAEQ